MKFQDRTHVETVGRFGLAVEKDEEGLRARQLDSFWLYVDEEDAGYTKHAVGDGYWEAWITLWMDRNVPPNSVCVDIGANHGYYSFYLSTNKNAEVYAFEPQPRLAALLRKSNKVNNSKVIVKEIAVSDNIGSVDMMVPIHHGMNATISNQFSYAPDGENHIKVKTETLNHLFGKEDVAFIKVDAEGAEDLIWAGSKEFRKNNPNALWLMEWRWDRYTKPLEFAKEIFEEFTVSSVEFDGGERRIFNAEDLAEREHEDWMLVLRGN